MRGVLCEHLELLGPPSIDCPGMDATGDTPNPPTETPATSSDQQIRHRRPSVATKKLASRPCASTAYDGRWHGSVPHTDRDLEANDWWLHASHPPGQA